MRATICRTWEELKAKPQSARSKLNSPWSNLPKGSGSLTLVHSTSGRKYGWLGCGRRSIGPLSRDRTVWNCCEMGLYTGTWRLQFFCRLSQPGWLWKMSIMLNGSSNHGWKCFRRNVQVRCERGGSREGEATSDQWRIWLSARATKWEVTSQSCQLQLWWLWFVECQMTTMTRHPGINSKLQIQMWGTGRSWLIPSKKIGAQKNHTVGLRYSNATWRRKNWRKSSWDYMHRGKWWMTLYIIRFHTTVLFLMHSSWTWTTVWNYFW